MKPAMKKAGGLKAGGRQRQASVKAELDATVARLATMDLGAVVEEDDSPTPSPPAAAAAAAAAAVPVMQKSDPRGFRMPNGKVVPPGDFKEIAILGVGTFSRVRMMQYNGVTYAMKMMKKQKVDQLKQKTHIMNEKETMIEMNHPFLLRLISTYKDSIYLYMLLELCQGGELFSRLLELKTLDEDTTRFYAGCIVLGLEALHGKDNIYRDLKPENILLDSQGYVKIVDFGFAKKVTDRTYTTCGTPEYVSPEMLEHDGHNKATDYWTLGIFIYECLCGTTPFAANNYLNTYDKILAYAKRGKLKWPTPVSQEVQSLICGLMAPKPEARLGCQPAGCDDIKRHPWFTGFDWDAVRAPLLPLRILARV